MRPKYGLFALMVGGLLFAASTASAQLSTGTLKGQITDAASGDPVAGATVVVTSPSLQGTQTAITEGDGLYEIANLPPGTYLITVYYLEAETRRPNALVQLGKTALVNIRIDTTAESGEVIEVVGRAPIIDQGSTKTGRTITQDFTENIPTGQTFGGVLGTAAGSQGDLYGFSFGGSTSAENTYIVEGINTTDPAFGLQSTNLPNEFIQETEVITGGYNAEYGRSTGAVVNVLTKAGSNEFHGSVFTYYTPGSFTADEVVTPSAGSSIETNSELDYNWSLGAEVGGPILKDKLWFHVGLTPSFSNTKLHRILNRRVDANADGGADIDANGFPVLEEVDRYTFDVGGRGPANLSTLYFHGKLTAAVSPDHQGSVAFLGNPITTASYGTLTGIPDAGDYTRDDGAWDFSLKWTSKLNNNKTQFDAVFGFHRNVYKINPATGTSDATGAEKLSATPGIRIDPRVSLETYAEEEMTYYNGVPEQCIDDDPDDSFVPCPVQFYNIGGFGYRETQVTDRLSGMLSATQRVKLAGQHTFKVGVDMEDQAYDHLSDFTGGYRYRLRTFGLWQADRWYSVGGEADTAAGEVMEQCDLGGDAPVDCVFKKNGLVAVTETRNMGAYAQDSWAILPNLTVNLGLRWEQQRLQVSDEIKAQSKQCLAEATTPGQRLLCPDEDAFVVGNMFAPRLGVIYDPTQEGRSKINAHWGRFYESIPMDINARAFGGEVFGIRYLLDCPNPTPGNPDCAVNDPENIFLDFFLGGGEEGVVPGIKGQYLDEFVIGGEYELLNDFKVGASYVHRALGRVIEDISTDGGTTYIIANPGEANEGAIQDYASERAVLVSEGLITQEQLDAELELYRAAADFDVPIRRYDALNLTAEKRFTTSLMMQASYTYSKTYGNFPGLFSPETGQLDPNLTSMYDLPELMANRTGPLAADRPHLFKLDGFYKLDLERSGILVFGSSVRASSGIPHNILGSHPVYGSGESYILPRGAWDRGVFTTSFDAHISYGRRLNKNMRLEAFVRIFNLFNQQPPTDVSEFYTFDVVNPCVGCDLDDLAHVKAVNPSDPTQDLSGTLDVDPNFGNTTQRQGPRSVTLGARLTF